MTKDKLDKKEQFMEKESKSLKTVSSGKKRSKIIRIVLVFVSISLFTGYKFLSFTKKIEDKREAFETQRQVMIEYWEEQGLSDEEIQLKLKDLRQERIEGGERPSGTGIMRLFGGRHSLEK